MNFTYATYQNSMNRDQSTNTKVGFFKLGDGEEAIARFNIGSMEDLQFNSVHKANFGQKYAGLPGFSGISCLNAVGSYDANTCPFCAAAANKHEVVGAAKKLVFVQMMVCYKDKATGVWSAPAPAVWERPAGFAREIATILSEYGDMRQRMFKVTRTGQKTETRYSLLPIDKDSPVFKAEMIPTDFSAFNNFDFARHSFWVKTAQELNDYLISGSFPEVAKSAPAVQAPAAQAPTTYTQPVAQATQAPAQQANTGFGAPFVPNAAPSQAPAQTPVQAPIQAPQAQTAEQPARNFGTGFGGFKF